MEHPLFTIGYERKPLPAFLARVAEAGVETLLDVRELPLSRVRGFSKTALSAALQARGIGYRHLPALGSPRALRRALHQTGDFAAFTRGYLAHLQGQTDAVHEAQQLAYDRTCCLLCFEQNHQQCHRQFVALAMRTTEPNGLAIVHL
jgi:uncharacterized protein (DUF488 family)